MMTSKNELLRTAHQRLYPSLTNPHYLVLRRRRLIFTDWLNQAGQDLTVLDIGGRYQPYRPLLEGKIRNYFALDVQKTDLVDVLGSGENLPFKKASFDLIIATAVFEYFLKPHQAAEQIHSALKPGGVLLMSIASVLPRIVDEECWRFTPRGVKSVLAPFSSVTIIPEVQSIGGLCRFLNLSFHYFLKLKPLQTAYELTMCPIINILGRSLEGLNLTRNDQWTGNYSVLARK